MRRPVIAKADVSGHIPIGGTAILWLLLDRFDLPSWIDGAAWTLWAIVIIVSVINLAVTKSVRIDISKLAKLEVDDEG